MIDSSAPITQGTFNANALIGGCVENIKTIRIQRVKKLKQVHEDLKVGDRYQLNCGHEGKVVWISPDEQSFAVQGRRRSCTSCGKKSSGAWTPTVYTFQRQVD
jgi:hypothetical protein